MAQTADIALVHLKEDVHTETTAWSPAQASSANEVGSHVSGRTQNRLHQRGQVSYQLEPEDEEEYPEGGREAWSVVLGSFLGLLALFGLTNSMGAIQAYVSHEQLNGRSESQVSWIFSTYMFISYVFSGQVGALFDSYGPFHLLSTGSVIFVLGLMLTSIAHTYIQFFMFFGVFCGVGGCLIMTPLVATVGHWFNRKRAVALSIATVGGNLGGVIFPIMLRKLYATVGYAWAIRIFGFICMCSLLASLFLLKPRLARSQLKLSLRNIVDVQSLREPRFAWLVLGNFLGDLAVVNGITYLASYALAQGQTQSMAYSLLTILNATGMVGRWISGLIADRFGRFNTLIGSSFIAAFTVLVVWLPFGHKSVGIIMFAVLHGFTNGAIYALIPVCVGQISKTQEYGRRYGCMYFFGSFGVLLGIPMSGALIRGNSYQWLILFTGLAYSLTGVAVYISRYSTVGFKLCKI